MFFFPQKSHILKINGNVCEIHLCKMNEKKGVICMHKIYCVPISTWLFVKSTIRSWKQAFERIKHHCSECHTSRLIFYWPCQNDFISKNRRNEYFALMKSFEFYVGMMDRLWQRKRLIDFLSVHVGHRSTNDGMQCQGLNYVLLNNSSTVTHQPQTTISCHVDTFACFRWLTRYHLFIASCSSAGLCANNTFGSISQFHVLDLATV